MKLTSDIKTKVSNSFFYIVIVQRYPNKNKHVSGNLIRMYVSTNYRYLFRYPAELFSVTDISIYFVYLKHKVYIHKPSMFGYHFLVKFPFISHSEQRL